VATVKLKDDGDVAALSAEVDLTHSWAGDVTIVLSHGGVSVTLFDQWPGDGSLSSNFDGKYTFVAAGDAFSKLGDNVTIPSGNYTSLDPLSAFAGLASGGDWTVTVSDNCLGDKGTLKGFVMHVSSTCMGSDSCSGTCNSGECICTAPP